MTTPSCASYARLRTHRVSSSRRDRSSLRVDDAWTRVRKRCEIQSGFTFRAPTRRRRAQRHHRADRSAQATKTGLQAYNIIARRDLTAFYSLTRSFRQSQGSHAFRPRCRLERPPSLYSNTPSSGITLRTCAQRDHSCIRWPQERSRGKSTSNTSPRMPLFCLRSTARTPWRSSRRETSSNKRFFTPSSAEFWMS